MQKLILLASLFQRPLFLKLCIMFQCFPENVDFHIWVLKITWFLSYPEIFQTYWFRCIQARSQQWAHGAQVTLGIF